MRHIRCELAAHRLEPPHARDIDEAHDESWRLRLGPKRLAADLDLDGRVELEVDFGFPSAAVGQCLGDQSVEPGLADRLLQQAPANHGLGDAEEPLRGGVRRDHALLVVERDDGDRR